MRLEMSPGLWCRNRPTHPRSTTHFRLRPHHGVGHIVVVGQKDRPCIVGKASEAFQVIGQADPCLTEDEGVGIVLLQVLKIAAVKEGTEG
jgi:hypothetical protein